MNRETQLKTLCHELEIFMKFEGCKGFVKLETEFGFLVLNFKIKIANSNQLKMLVEKFDKFETTFSFEALPNDYVKFFHTEPAK